MEQLLAYFAKEGSVVKGAPGAFSTGIVLIGLIIWAGLAFINNERFSTLEERIRLKDDQIASLQGEKTALEAMISETQATMDAMGKRLRALEDTLLTGVLEGAPSSVELLAKPDSDSGILAKLTGTLEGSGWHVMSAVATGATAEFFRDNEALAIIKPASQGATETMKSALDAAQIPYEVRAENGMEAIWLKAPDGASLPNRFQGVAP